MKMPPIHVIKITHTLLNPLLESFENDFMPAFQYEIAPLRHCCYGDTWRHHARARISIVISNGGLYEAGFGGFLFRWCEVSMSLFKNIETEPPAYFFFVLKYTS